MKTIHKYRLAVPGTQIINLPQGFDLLFAGHDPNQHPCVWALVDTTQPLQPVTFHLIGTGQPIPSNYLYFDSFIQNQYVWHVFFNSEL
jgi:hypothetical protein